MWTGCLLILSALLCSPAGAQGTDSRNAENSLKAAFLVRFAQFVTWPDDGDSSSGAATRTNLVLGVVNLEEFGEAFQAYDQTIIRGRALEVRPVSSPDDARACDVLFINTDSRSELQAYVTAVDGLPILTVADQMHAARTMVMINFFRINRKLRFEIHLSRARAAGLHMRSSLLELAIIVGEEEEGP